MMFSFIKVKIDPGLVNIINVTTENQIVDVFTAPVSKTKLSDFRTVIELLNKIFLWTSVTNKGNTIIFLIKHNRPCM